MRNWCALAVVMCLAGIALVLSPTVNAASAAKEQVPIKEVGDVQIIVDGVVLNNIVVAKDKSLVGGREYVRFEASLRNKNNTKRDVAAFMVCHDKSGNVVCCAGLTPGFGDTIQPETTESAKGDYFVDEGDFAKIATVWVRFVVR